MANNELFNFCLPDNYDIFINKAKKYKYTNLEPIKDNDDDIIRLRDLHALYHIYCSKTQNPYEKVLYGTNYSWVDANENPSYNEKNITDDTTMGPGYDDASTAVGGRGRIRNTKKRHSRKRIYKKSMKRK